MKKLFLFLFVSASLLIPSAARAAERIISFDVTMAVQSNGSAIVEETITVNAEHIQIRRGIYRDIPNSAEAPVKFISLYMDNQPHPSFTENPRNMLRINFGNDDYISTGVHTYKLTYAIAKLVSGFDGYDEVYWNVTGNGWAFPIEHASFRISLPAGADIFADKVSTYTGRRGSKGSTARQIDDNSFETTETLSSGEGFTVAIPFKKGVVQSFKRAEPFKRPPDYVFMGIAALLFICSLMYYFVSWFRVGKDPYDTIVTEFEPPEGISAAFTRQLWNRRFDNKTFATALVSLAMKGKIEISEEKAFFSKTAVLNLTDKNTNGLSSEEEYILNTLFKGSDTFAMNTSNGVALQGYISHVRETLDKASKEYINPNTKYIVLGTIPLALLQLLFIPIAPQLIFINIFYLIFMSAIFANIKTNKFAIALVFIFLNLFFSAFFWGFGVAAVGYVSPAIIMIQACFLLSFWTFLVYMKIIDIPTDEGRALLIKLKGFYRYMSIAEEHRVAASNPIDAERIFADYLPYAFAFDMENKWMKEFEGILSKAVIDTHINRLGGMNVIAGGLLVHSINNSMPRSSGSGSGGGGFSGGGFGGGGGGGR